MTRVLAWFVAAAFAAGCGAAGVGKPGSPAFDVRLVPNNKEKVAQVSAAVRAAVAAQGAKAGGAQNALGKPVLLAVKSGKPPALLLVSLDDGKLLWSKEREIAAKPTLLWDTVIVKTAKGLAGVRLDSGEERWMFDPKGWDYFGAAQEGDRIFVSLGIGGECRKVGVHRGKVVALSAGGGSVLWEREAENHCLGAPAAAGGYVFLPLDMQNISILEAGSGDETARLLSLDDNITFVASFPEGVFYGSKGLYSFDEKSYSGLNGGAFDLTIKANDPVLLTLVDGKGNEVTLYRSKGGAPAGFENVATPLGRWEMGQDRFVELTPKGSFKVTSRKGELTTLQLKGTILLGGDGTYVIEEKKIRFAATSSTYYTPPLGKIPGDPELYPDRISPVLGLTNARDKIRWVWVPAAAPQAGAVALAGGRLLLIYYRFLMSIDAQTGQLAWAYRSALDVEDVTVNAGGIFIADRKGDVTRLDPVSGEVTGKLSTGAMITAATLNVGGAQPAFPPVAGGPARTLRESLVEMILDKDNRLVPIRQLALGFLAAIQEPEVTRDLLTVYMDKYVPAELKTIARQKLVERESGAAYMVEAMQYHFDYLNEVSPPPMGVVAQALVKMKAREGVVALMSHLLDHETSLEDLREVAAAILVLGDESVVPTVSEYLVRYHADSAFKGNLDTLYLLADAVLAFGGVQGRELLEKLQADPNTVPALAVHIKDAFGAAAQKELDAKLAAENPGEAAAPAVSSDAIVEEGKVYQTLTQKQVMAVLDPHRAELAPCIQDYIAGNANPVYQIRMKFILNNKGKIEKFMTLPSDPKLSSCLMGELLKIKWPKIKELKQALQYVVSVEKPKPVAPEWPPLPVAVQPQPQPQPAQPQPQPKPDEWLPVPKPQPLPQPVQPQPQPQPLPQPEEKKPQPEEKKPDEKKPDAKKPEDKKPEEKQPGFQEYPDTLPEDLPQK